MSRVSVRSFRAAFLAVLCSCASTTPTEGLSAVAAAASGAGDPSALALAAPAASLPDAAALAAPAPDAPALPLPLAPGEPERPAAAMTAEITAEQVLTRIAFLASDSLEGRESGTPGGVVAEDYVAAELSRMGFEPLGDTAGSPFVTVPLPWKPLLPNRSFVDATLADGSTLHLTPKEGAVPFAFSASGSVTGELVFAGYGLQSADYDDWAGIDAKGKIAIIVRHGPREDKPESPWYVRGKPEQLAAMSFAQKAKNAADHGAVAVLMVNDQTHKSDMMPTASPGDDTAIPVVAIKRETANRMLRAIGKELMDFENGIVRDLTPRSCDVPGVRVSVVAAHGETRARDVVFIRRGTDPVLRDEAVVLGAHMDHVGFGWFGSLAGSGQIHNGADDNASGTAAILEVAEALAAGPPTKRSIIIAGWCGEEKGLVGSGYWCDHPTFDLAKIVANVNLDMVGRYRGGDEEPRFLIEGGVTGSGLEELAHRAARAHGLKTLSSWESWEQSDHFSFYAKKIPALFLHTGLHPDYHRPADDWWKVNGEGEALIASATLDIVRQIADLPERPTFKPKPPRPILGVQMGDGGNGGAVFAMVLPKGPAAEAGMLPKDVVIEFQGRPVTNAEDLQHLLATTTPGDTIEVTYMRGAEKRTTKVKIGGR